MSGPVDACTCHVQTYDLYLANRCIGMMVPLSRSEVIRGGDQRSGITAALAASRREMLLEVRWFIDALVSSRTTVVIIFPPLPPPLHFPPVF